LINASGERKTPLIRSHNDAECWPKFGRIVSCWRAEPSRTFGRILRPNFGVYRTSAHLYYVCSDVHYIQSGRYT